MGVFEGVECDFDNNFNDWISFKKFQFLDGFWPRKICQKLKKSLKILGSSDLHEIKLKKGRKIRRKFS